VIRQVTGLVNPYAERRRHAGDTLTWIAAAALGQKDSTTADAITQLREQLPAISPSTAADLARWVHDEDQAARRLLREPDDHVLIPGVTCPGCDCAGTLALRMSGPAEDRVVVCTEDCPCDETSCWCGMSVKAAGAAHIWTMAEFRASGS
jgi:hypothetical protein